MGRPKPSNELVKAYSDSVALIDETRCHFNGLMVVARPVFESVAGVYPDPWRRDGMVTQKVYGRYGFIEPALNIYGIRLEDVHSNVPGSETAYNYKPTGIEDSKFTIYTSRVDGEGWIKHDESCLTWGYAESSLVKGNPTTSEDKVGADYSAALYPKGVESLNSELAQAYVARLASGLLIIRMIDRVAEGEGASLRIDTEGVYERTAELVTAWAGVDAEAANRVWAPYQQAAI